MTTMLTIATAALVGTAPTVADKIGAGLCMVMIVALAEFLVGAI